MSELSSPTSVGLYFLVELIAVVVGSVAVYYLLRAEEKPKIIIVPASHPDRRLGFGIYVKKKTVKNAQVICNLKKCDWEEDDNGKKGPKKTLIPGDNFSNVFPFQAKVKEVDDMSKFSSFPIYSPKSNDSLSQKGLLFTIEEIATSTIIGTWGCIIPDQRNIFLTPNLGAPQLELKLGISLRVIGDGIEEARNYLLLIGFDRLFAPPQIPEGKSLADYIGCEYEIEEKRRFGWRKLKYSL